MTWPPLLLETAGGKAEEPGSGGLPIFMLFIMDEPPVMRATGMGASSLSCKIGRFMGIGASSLSCKSGRLNGIGASSLSDSSGRLTTGMGASSLSCKIILELDFVFFYDAGDSFRSGPLRLGSGDSLSDSIGRLRSSPESSLSVKIGLLIASTITFSCYCLLPAAPTIF